MQIITSSAGCSFNPKTSSVPLHHHHKPQVEWFKCSQSAPSAKIILPKPTSSYYFMNCTVLHLRCPQSSERVRILRRTETQCEKRERVSDLWKFESVRANAE